MIALLKKIGHKIIEINKKVIHLPSRFIKWLQVKFIKHCSKKKIVFKREGNDRYHDLAPVDTLKSNNAYIEALDWALCNDKIYNIGISGPYGSGKSSVIASYCKLHPELNYIKISMADFEPSPQKDIKTDGSDESLEAAFLKQLFYKVGFRTIPRSRYHKLHKTSKWRVLLAVVSLFIVLLGAFLLFFKDTAEGILESIKSSWKIDSYSAYFILAALFCILVFIVYKLVLRFSNKINIKEIKIDIIEAKNDAEEKESIFNKNLDEIVYFFETTRYKVVFIEDLDRFNNPSIFVKLRNLNIILNNYKEIKRRIVFVYAVKDEIFINNDRTKFFDYLIPIIPIINSTNSNEKLLERINEDRKKGYKIDVDDDFIDYISVYISDMRILINTYNEFILYKSALDESQSLRIKDRNLFSMLLFKNIYPVEFADIQNEKGIIKKAFNLKKAFVKRKRNELEVDLKELFNQLEQLDQTHLNNLKELKAVFLNKITNYSGSFISIHNNHGRFFYDDIMKDDFDMNLLEGDNVTVTRNIKGSTREIITICDTEEYIDRSIYLLESKEQSAERIRKKINECQDDITNLSSLSLKQLINKYSSKIVLDDSVCQNKLLSFLLRNGYIDEDYPNYINIFHANSITQNDMNFILSVRNHEAMDYSYALTKKKQVIKRLQEVEFLQPEVYNYDLVEEMLSNPSEPEYVNKRNNLFMQLSYADNSALDFIEGCRSSLPSFEKFISKLSHFWHGLWDYVYDNSALNDDEKDKYFRTICSYAAVDDIEQMNKNKKVNHYFQNNPNVFQRLFDVNDEKLKEIIAKCTIIFSDVNYSQSKTELLNWVFAKGCYDITPETISLRFDLGNTNSMEMVKSQIYTSIIRSDDKILMDKIDKEPDSFIEKVILAEDENTHETINSVLSLISKSDKVENICQLIEKENIILNSLSDCDFEKLEDQLSTVWQKWLSSQKTAPTWENIETYYSRIGFDDTLLEFIENNIRNASLPTNKEEPLDNNIAIEIITSSIDKDILEKLIPILPANKDINITINKVTPDNLSLLIQNNYFEIDQAFINNLKESHPDLLANTLIQYHKEILERKIEYSIETKESTIIVESKSLSDNDKIGIICSSNSYSLSEHACLFFRDFQQRIPKTLFWDVWDGLDKDLRYQLLLNQLDYLQDDDISKCFADLDPMYNALANKDCRHKEYLYASDYNYKLLEKLKRKGYISSFKEAPNTDSQPERYECWVRKKD